MVNALPPLIGLFLPWVSFPNVSFLLSTCSLDVLLLLLLLLILIFILCCCCNRSPKVCTVDVSVSEKKTANSSTTYVMDFSFDIIAAQYAAISAISSSSMMELVVAVVAAVATVARLDDSGGYWCCCCCCKTEYTIFRICSVSLSLSLRSNRRMSHPTLPAAVFFFTSNDIWMAILLAAWFFGCLVIVIVIVRVCGAAVAARRNTLYFESARFHHR
jgi:hypothetical protein